MTREVLVENTKSKEEETIGQMYTEIENMQGNRMKRERERSVCFVLLTLHNLEKDAALITPEREGVPLRRSQELGQGQT